jgi:hypothetical protein
MEEIHADTIVSIQAVFMHQMNSLLQHRDNKIVTAMLNSIDVNYSERGLFCRFFEGWLKQYGEQQWNYKLMKYGLNLSLSHRLSINSRMDGSQHLIKQQIKVSNKRKDPTIISGNKDVECFEDSSKLSYIVNIGNN